MDQDTVLNIMIILAAIALAVAVYIGETTK